MPSTAVNIALRQRASLQKANYVRVARRAGHYWIGWDESRVSEYVAAFGDQFSLVIIGDRDALTDFFVVPYAAVKHLLITETLTLQKGGRRRWMAAIRHNLLRVTNCPRLDIGEYYGNPSLISSALVPVSKSEANEYAIENRRAEIGVRLKQSVFRKAVLANFGNTCCISNVCEPDLLVASHIVPWAAQVGSRLDPANGLCLFSVYDRLFDQGYISLEDDLRILTPPKFNCFSARLQEILRAVDGRCIRPPQNVAIRSDFLAYHRQHVFLSGNRSGAMNDVTNYG